MKAILVFLFFTNLAVASPALQSLQLEIVYGDKVTKFDIHKAGNKTLLDYSNNQGDKATREVTDRDLVYILTRYLNSATKDEVEGNCRRSVISASTTVDGKASHVTACLFGKGPSAKSLRSLANLLSTRVELAS